MIVSKVCLLSVVLCVFWFGAVHCQQQGIPPWLASLWLPGHSKNDSNKMDNIDHHRDSLYKRVLDSKCETNEIEDAVQEVQMCKYESGIYQPLDDETEDSVKAYCRMIRHVKDCYIRMATKVVVCLNFTERLHLNHMMDAVQQLVGYLCDNQGEKLSQFIAKGGPVCFDKLTGPLQDCLKGNSLIRNSGLDDLHAGIFKPMFETEQCEAVEETRDCMVGTLRRYCDRPTPADMTATMMDILIKGTPCRDLIKPSAAESVSGVHALLAVTAAVALLLQPAP